MINLQDTKVNGKNLSDLQSHFAPDHLEDLKRSGLSDETIRQANILSVPPNQIEKILGPALARKVSSLLKFPYNHGSDFARCKLFPTVTDKHGHKLKYFQPRGSKPSLYIPPGVKDEDLQDVKKPLWSNEGEKKALRWAQEGFECCIGISGAWNWKDGYSLYPKLIEDFNEIPLSERVVNVIVDSDFQTNPNVKHGYLQFANALLQKRAKVYFIIIPIGKNGEKQGLDDFLQSNHHTVKDVLRLPRMEITLEVLRSFEAEFPRLASANDFLEDVLNGLGNDHHTEHDGRTIPKGFVESLWGQIAHGLHTCKILHSKIDMFFNDKTGWFGNFQEDTWRCEACAWERGKQIAMALANNFPDGFWYLLMPKDEDHNWIRKRIVGKKGIGAKLISQGGKKKAILANISVDPKMRFISWGDEEMKELFLKFLTHEPNWKVRSHKFDSFGDFLKEAKMNPCKAKSGYPIHIRISVEPGKTVEEGLKQVGESLKKLGCEVSETGDFILSPLAKKFFKEVIERKSEGASITVFPLPFDDPLRHPWVLSKME